MTSIGQRRSLIAIVDDDEAVRDSLALLLRLHGFDVQAFASGEDFVAWAGTQPVDCVLLDLRMQGMSGLDVQAALAARGLDYPVIVLTAHGDVATTRTTLKAGAFDFIEKPFDDALLLRAIQAASEASEKRRAREVREVRFAQSLARLTPREREVLDHVLAGRHNREIAALLGISPRTVEVYRANVMTKTGAASLSELVRMALLAQF